MLKRSRSCIAAFIACAIPLLVAATANPSYNVEAGQKYRIASQRLAELRKNSNKKLYRSYWIDCVRTFELIEKKYPQSPKSADACIDRAGIFRDLYLINRVAGDLEEALQINGKCQSAYPRHGRAPEALYRIVELSLDYKKDNPGASEAFAKMTTFYPESSWTGKARSRFKPLARQAGKKQKQETEIRNMPVPVIAAPGKTKPAGVVTGIRHWSEGAYTRIVIDESKQVVFQAQKLQKPDRLVFDLLHARIDNSLNKEPLPINDGILKQVRARQYTPDIVRIVLDLASVKSYAAFPLHDPDRLVIDVTGEGGKNAETPAASMGTGTQRRAELPAAQEEQAKPAPQIISPPLVKAPELSNNEGERLSLSRQLGLKIKTIAIDAGHGGHDPGAIGKSGLKEKNITLDIAKRLSALVKDRLGCTVVMTRDKDEFIPLEQRPFIAKSRGADLFVSIHVNANRKRRTRGIETYIQGLNASDRDAMATAARENATTQKKLNELDTELKKILQGLKKGDDDFESLYLADSVQGSLVSNLKPINRHVGDLKSRIKRAFFYVLINTEMPSILAEVGFISNPDEETMLKNDSYRQAIAEALYQGVKKYVEARSPQMMGV